MSEWWIDVDAAYVEKYIELGSVTIANIPLLIPDDNEQHRPFKGGQNVGITLPHLQAARLSIPLKIHPLLECMPWMPSERSIITKGDCKY